MSCEHVAGTVATVVVDLSNISDVGTSQAAYSSHVDRTGIPTVKVDFSGHSFKSVGYARVLEAYQKSGTIVDAASPKDDRAALAARLRVEGAISEAIDKRKGPLVFPSGQRAARAALNRAIDASTAAQRIAESRRR
jgi:hypothetical protein